MPPEAPSAGPFVVAFLRHTGCPFAEYTLRELRAAAREHPGLTWIALSHAPPAATDKWSVAVGGASGVTLLSDTDRTFYSAWGLGRTSMGHFAGRRSLTEVARLAREGVRNRHATGSRWQQAGTFAVDHAGTVAWRHLPEHAGDLPDLDEAAAAACR